jgi:hypothetical protein
MRRPVISPATPKKQPANIRLPPLSEGGAMTGSMLTLRSWKRLDKPGSSSSLIGFANVTLPYRGGQLEVDDLPVLMSNGKAWAAFPGKPVLTSDGHVARLPGSSKPRYVSFLRWGDRETTERFSRAVVSLVRSADPEAFEDREGTS